MLVNKIIEILKTGSIKNIVLFGDGMKIPPTPYVVIKPETGSIPGTRQFRFFVHMEQGRQEELDNYLFTELAELLLKEKIKDDENKLHILYSGEWFDVRADEQEKTICMERIFYFPFNL